MRLLGAPIAAGFVLLVCVLCSGCGQARPQAILQTEKGTLVIELYPDAAPKTVENFATLIDQGFYDGLIFHRYEPGFVIQGGDPKGDGTGGPGWKLYGEFQDPVLLAKMPAHEKGVVAMARRGNDPDSAGSQFYICLNPDPDRYAHLNAKYTTFGRVVKGMDVVDQLLKGDRIEKMTLKGYSPQKSQ